MTKTLEQIKEAFNQADKNKNHILNLDEFKAGLQLLDIKVDEHHVNRYFTHSPSHKGKKFNYSDFELFVTFNESVFANDPSMLGGISEVLSGVNRFFHTKNVFFAENVETDINIQHLSETKPIETKLAFAIGDFNSNAKLPQIVRKEVTSKLAFVLDVVLANNAGAVEKLNTHLKGLKEFLTEISAEAKDFLQPAEFFAVETPAGVQLIFDFDRHAFIDSALRVIHPSSKNLQEQPIPVYFDVRSSYDLGNKVVSLVDFLKEEHGFDIYWKNISLNHNLKQEEQRKAFKEFIAMFDFLSPLNDLLLESNSYKINLQTSEAQIAQIIEKAGNPPLDQVKIDVGTTAEKIIEDSGASELIAMAEDAIAILKLLHAQGASETSLIVKIDQFYASVELKFSVWDHLKHALKLE